MKTELNGSDLAQILSIAVRPVKKFPLLPIEEALLNAKTGLEGDHYSGKSGKRHLTLISEQELKEVANLLGKGEIDPLLTRRNIVYAGSPISEDEFKLVGIGNEVRIKITGPCRPCQRMDENFGPGSEEAMKNRAGLTARVVIGGKI